MIKQLLALIILSFIVIFTMSYLQQGLESLVSLHHWISESLMKVFSGDKAGDITRKLLALLSVPVVIAFIPVLIYWVVKRQWFPYFMQIMWVMWLVQTTALIVLLKAV